MSLRNVVRGTSKRSSSTLNLQQYIDLVTKGGLGSAAFGLPASSLGSKQEEIQSNFQSLVQNAYKANGIVFAVMLARQLVFSEATFQYRRRVNGRPGELYGTPALKPLEEPTPGGTTGNLLTRMIQDADLGGNWFGARRPGERIKRLRPDWMTIILGSHSDPDIGFGDVDAEVLGYIYKPGGAASEEPGVPFLAGEVAHWAPVPDPTAAFRGMSWLEPVIREIMGDQAATEHKLKFFEQGATPNLVVSLDAGVTDPETFQKWVDMFESEHGGVENAYKTLYLGAGSKAEVVGSDMRNVDFKKVQGAGETRIAAAAGVPPIIVGLSEGLEAATYSNYGQARRRFADATLRPLWRDAAGCLSKLVTVPLNSELWYDARDIPFLQEDEQDKADIQQKQAETINRLVEAGYKPDSIIEAVTADDMSRLVHSGLVSVQLQTPGAESPSGNGNGAVPALPSGE